MGIFCPVHWKNLPCDTNEFKAEHELSKSMLTLPSDHRYGEADMQRVINALLKLV
jgi:dTDP-4-amino-4,6-dideoxygalactose transaminase